jgi:sugar O-acyltransferase (sialic acid O-acetyltransferase NeuD family)
MAESDRAIVILGAGGHARVVGEAIGAERVAGHLSPGNDGSTPDALLGPRLGSDDTARELAATGYAVAIGVGFVGRDGAERRAGIISALNDIELVTVRHVDASISGSAQIGAGSFIGPGAIVGAGATIGRAAIVNTGAIIDHDCVLGANVHVAPGATLSGDVTVGDNTLIGVGARVIQGVRIGAGVVVGAGAVVIDDLADGVTAVGVPARTTA